MKPRLLFGLALVGLCGLAAGAWWAQRSAGINHVVIETPDGTPAVSETEELADVAAAPTGGAPLTPEETQRLVELRGWLRDEARAVNRTGVDENARLREIQNKLRKFTPTEWGEVARQILDTEGPANERVLSAFMMGLGGFFDLAAVERVLDEKLPEGPARPHSEEEVRLMRERSLRLMVIDGLISEAKKDPSKRDLLAQAIRRIDDPYLRDLANQRARAEGLE